jgi:hypothetical protein
VRAAYGALLLIAPGASIQTASGEPAGRPFIIITLILGLRHLAQTLLLELGATRGQLLLGATVEATHVLSMAGLGVLGIGSNRRPAVLDATLAAGMTLNGLRRARNA